MSEKSLEEIYSEVTKLLISNFSIKPTRAASLLSVSYARLQNACKLRGYSSFFEYRSNLIFQAIERSLEENPDIEMRELMAKYQLSDYSIRKAVKTVTEQGFEEFKHSFVVNNLTRQKSQQKAKITDLLDYVDNEELFGNVETSKKVENVEEVVSYIDLENFYTNKITELSKLITSASDKTKQVYLSLLFETTKNYKKIVAEGV